MNIHLPAILGFTRYQGFDPSPSDNESQPTDLRKPVSNDRNMLWGTEELFPGVSN